MKHSEESSVKQETSPVGAYLTPSNVTQAAVHKERWREQITHKKNTISLLKIELVSIKKLKFNNEEYLFPLKVKTFLFMRLNIKFIFLVVIYGPPLLYKNMQSSCNKEKSKYPCGIGFLCYSIDVYTF